MLTRLESSLQILRKDPPKTALSRTRANGEIVTYDAPSNTFAITKSDGTPKTMFTLGPKGPSNPRGYDPNEYSSPMDYFMNSY